MTSTPERAAAGGALRGLQLQANASRLLLQRLLELVRFAAVGTLSVALNVGIIVFATELLGLNYLVSIVICFVTVTVISFCCNRCWTFKKSEGRIKAEMLRYTLTAVGQLVVCLGCCSICVQEFHVPYQLAVIGLSVAFVPVTYLLHRRWSFKLKWQDPVS